MGFLFIEADKVDRYRNKRGIIFVDVREKEDFDVGHIEGAVNIPFDELEQKAKKLAGYSLVILYCYRGNQSLQGVRLLLSMGVRAASLGGGYEGYERHIELTKRHKTDRMGTKESNGGIHG